MSVLLYIVGALAIVLGVGIVAYGIPVNEFSFGNTLIIAGTTTAVGGLIVIAIGVAVGKLQRIAGMLAARTPARHPLDMFEPQGTPGRALFPSRPVNTGEAQAVTDPGPAPLDEESAAVAPILRNPESSMAEQHEVKAEAPSHGPPVMEETTVDEPWRPPAAPQPQEERPSRSFDAMWPALRPAQRFVADELSPAPKPEAAPQELPSKDPEVAILKSGVVDGMGYTLYVDGSIEAELPHGTLRFGSINELREHLAKNF